MKQVGRGIRSELPAPNRVGTNSKLGFSGLCPGGICKSPGMGPVQPLWVACSTSWMSWERKDFSYGDLQILAIKFDWMAFLVFGHKKAVIEEIRENTGILKHHWGCGLADHARWRLHRHQEYADADRLAQALLNVSQEVIIMPRPAPSSTLPLNMLDEDVICKT